MPISPVPPISPASPAAPISPAYEMSGSRATPTGDPTRTARCLSSETAHGPASAGAGERSPAALTTGGTERPMASVTDKAEDSTPPVTGERKRPAVSATVAVAVGTGQPAGSAADGRELRAASATGRTGGPTSSTTGGSERPTSSTTGGSERPTAPPTTGSDRPTSSVTGERKPSPSTSPTDPAARSPPGGPFPNSRRSPARSPKSNSARRRSSSAEA